MSWKQVGRPISTADNASTVPGVIQKFKLVTTVTPKVLRGISFGVVFYGNPVFTLLRAELWNENATKLIAVSNNSYTKLQCLVTEQHAFKDVGFTFDNVPLKPGALYSAALRPTVYTGNNSSHIAMRQVFPDPVYPTNVGTDVVFSMNVPYNMSFIVGDL